MNRTRLHQESSNLHSSHLHALDNIGPVWKQELRSRNNEFLGALESIAICTIMLSFFRGIKVISYDSRVAAQLYLYSHHVIINPTLK